MRDAKDIQGIILNKIEDYNNRLSEIMAAEEPDLELAGKYRYYIMCLSELNQQFFRLIEFEDHAAFETLRQNYEKYDTEFIFMDGSSYIVEKDDICCFKDNYILIQNKKEFEEDPTGIPSIEKAINLDNVKLIETLS